MCLSGEPRPIPKGTVWAWKRVSSEDGDIYPLTYYGRDAHGACFKRGIWLQAVWPSWHSRFWTKEEDFGFHANRKQTRNKGEKCIRVRLRGIIEATSEGYRAREMYIPVSKKRKVKRARRQNP